MEQTPKGTDLAGGIIEVAGLRFSTQLGIASAQWLEAELQMPILQVFEKLKEINEKNVNMTLMAKLVTALYIQANLDEDPKVAQRRVGALTLPQMMELVSRAPLATFEPKDGQPPENPTVPLTESGPS